LYGPLRVEEVGRVPAWALPRFIQRWLPRHLRHPPAIPERLWSSLLQHHGFLNALDLQDQHRLRLLTTHFLAEKEFHGAHGLIITDPMALAISAQACCTLLHIAHPDGRPPATPLDALDWYGDFVGIVVQPGAAVAEREITDGSGVVHRYREILAGESMDGGPIMLSWEEVKQAPQTARTGHNVVVHEFVHKLDMHSCKTNRGQADGAPALPLGFLGIPDPRQAQEHWRATMQTAYDQFCEAVTLWHRFGAEKPWLDSYGAQTPAEFFAVTSEAYFVNRERFEQAFPRLVPLYDGFYKAA
jgi:Mlc titration factor MtfA (ptsG expression regulator)